MKNTIQKSALSTNLVILIFVLCGAQLLHAQDDATLINVTNLEQLNAIRYDLDGDGVVVFTAEDPLLASVGNVDALAELSQYASQFTGGTYHTRVAGSDTPISDASMEVVVAGSIYVYKLSMTYEGYELMVNLDFEVASSYASGTINMDWTTGSGWDPVGNAGADGKTLSEDHEGFVAIFEGNGHTISNLFIDRSSETYLGLFGFVSGSTAELRNLGMVDVEVTGDRHVGGLVGANVKGTVSGSYATGSVTGSVTGFGNSVGGLVGINQKGTVSSSYATGLVTGKAEVGGLVGINFGDISGSYATGTVTGVAKLGGLVGINFGDISSSYAMGAVTIHVKIGPLVGGLVGLNYPSIAVITASYYSETTGQIDTGKGESKTTSELQTPTGYTGIYGSWDDGPDGMANNEDDTDYWDFGTNGQYPVLKLDVDGNGTVGDAIDLRLQRRPRLSVASFGLDFEDVNIASTTSNTMTYDLTGENLIGDVTLTIEGTNADLFTISPTDPIEPINGEVNQTITVTFDPTVAGDSFTAMITHSGGRLTSPFVVPLRGTGVTPPPPPVLLGFGTRAISNLRLSPNPVTGLLYVQGHGLGDMTVTVRSIAGKVHGSYTIRNTGKVPFSGLPSGMYIVQIVSQTGIVTKQVIKSSGL